nr:sigma-70 family RNA polymerase sigma factor [uncultured Duganella sp.]
MGDDRMTDIALVRRAASGDRHAFDLLFTKYHRRIFRVLSKLAPDAASAEDLVQETFIRVLRYAPDFRGDSSFYTWLFRIALNTARHAADAKKNQLFLNAIEFKDEHLRAGDEGCDDGLSGPELALLNKQTLRAIGEAIDDLPADLAQAIRMRGLEGYSYQQIAADMHCPLGTVRSRLSRARGFIVHRLDAAGLGDAGRDGPS